MFFPYYKTARRDGLLPYVPAHDRAALRQELQSSEPSRTVPHHLRGGVAAGNQRCGRGHWFPCNERKDII